MGRKKKEEGQSPAAQQPAEEATLKKGKLPPRFEELDPAVTANLVNKAKLHRAYAAVYGGNKIDSASSALSTRGRVEEGLDGLDLIVYIYKGLAGAIIPVATQEEMKKKAAGYKKQKAAESQNQ